MRERGRKTGTLCVCMNRERYVAYIIDGDTSATQVLYHGMARQGSGSHRGLHTCILSLPSFSKVLQDISMKTCMLQWLWFIHPKSEEKQPQTPVRNYDSIMKCYQVQDLCIHALKKKKNFHKFVFNVWALICWE